MGKFKVGDKVVPISKRGSIGNLEKSVEWKKASEKGQKFLYVNSFEGETIICHSRKTDFVTGDYFLEEDLRLFESKPTKKQRIKALEKRVEALEKLAEDYFKVPVEPSIERPKEEPRIPKGLMKTPNQLRAEIIEKAKGFVDKYLTSKHYGYGVVDNNTTPRTKISGTMKYRFVVNAEKRTVVAIGELYIGGIYDRYKGIAKCNPSDVFNEHIGKAIALGRALGLDVSEFKGAVQPTEVVIGQIYQYKFLGRDELHEITEVDDEWVDFKRGSYRGTHQADRFTTNNVIDGEKIILNLVNDTNAIYGEVE